MSIDTRILAALVAAEIIAGLWIVQNVGSLYVYLTN